MIYQIVAKVVDNLLLARIDSCVYQFHDNFDRAFTTGAKNVSSSLTFFKCTIYIAPDGSIHMGIISYNERVNPSPYLVIGSTRHMHLRTTARSRNTKRLPVRYSIRGTQYSHNNFMSLQSFNRG